MLIRTCEWADLLRLERCIASPGLSAFHERRFAEQVAGSATYLIAWLGARPVGHVMLRWSGPSEQEVAERLGRTPMLNALGVWPPEFRRRGVATELIRRAELLVGQRGSQRLGLGVAVDNVAAQRLYRRLGYRDWGHGKVASDWTSVASDGRRIRHHERLLIWLKDLG